jgi:Family of unknown function (DUF6521)
VPSNLGEPIRHIQNPALGSVLQWRFTVGYSEGSDRAAGCPLVLLFVPLPLLFHQSTYHQLKATHAASGMRAFVAKFSRSDTQEADILYALHDRTAAMRGVSLDSLQVALSFRLIGIDLATALVYPITSAPAVRGVPQAIQTMMKNAEKLGRWCAGLSLHEIAAILKVRF